MPLDRVVAALLERAQPLAQARAVAPVEAPRGLVADEGAIEPLDISRG